MLLTINEIEVRLHGKFSPFNGEMDDLILKKRMAPVNNIKHSEERLGVNFPKDFIEFVNNYDIDNFSLGNISFGHGDDYLEKIVRINNDEFNHWWIGEHSPDGVLQYQTLILFYLMLMMAKFMLSQVSKLWMDGNR